MRKAAFLALVAWLLLPPAQSLADELPVSSEPVDEQADAVAIQPEAGEPVSAITTRTLDPPTVVAPFSGSTPQDAVEETVAPLEYPLTRAQHLPPGPPNRLP